MASLSSALFFNFGSYSPYMDISSYLSLSPTFPTFSHQSVCCKVFPVFPPRFSPTHFSWLFLSIFVARFSHQLFPNNPHLAILQRLLWSAGVRMGARREDKKILPIGEEDHLQCTHTHPCRWTIFLYFSILGTPNSIAIFVTLQPNWERCKWPKKLVFPDRKGRGMGGRVFNGAKKQQKGYWPPYIRLEL